MSAPALEPGTYSPEAVPPGGSDAGRPPRVGVWGAFPAMRAGIRALLAEAGFDAIDAGVGDEQADELDVVVADSGQDLEGVLAALDTELPGVPVVVLASDPAEYGQLPAERRAPAGWLLRDVTADELGAAVLAVARGLTVIDPEAAAAVPRSGGPGGTPREAGQAVEALTDREREVLELMALGLPNKAIALRLGISEHTAKYHVGEILAKLDASSRTEAVTLAVRRGLLAL